MKHTQSAFQVLLLSANNKINHLARSLAARHSSSPVARFFQEFDQIILETFQQICYCPNLTACQITQIRLPERLSGLGFLSISQMASAAFLGSARQSLCELTQRNIISTQFDNLYQNNELNQSIFWTNSAVDSWNTYRQHFQAHNAPSPPPSWSSNMFLSLPSTRLQHALAHNLSKATQAHLISSASPADKIRTISFSATWA